MRLSFPFSDKDQTGYSLFSPLWEIGEFFMYWLSSISIFKIMLSSGFVFLATASL